MFDLGMNGFFFFFTYSSPLALFNVYHFVLEYILLLFFYLFPAPSPPSRAPGAIGVVEVFFSLFFFLAWGSKHNEFGAFGRGVNLRNMNCYAGREEGY